MTQHFGLSRLRFYLTEAQPCPYLPGKWERKVFTPLRGPFASELNDELSLNGFRRSQNVAYRPQCAGCTACVSTRIPVADFTPGKTQRRILRRNAHLTREAVEPLATEEHYELFRDYLEARHHDGAMAEMDALDFASMVDDTTVRTRLIEYREDGALIAAALTDQLADGLSMVYSFFEPGRERDSLGAFMVLDHVDYARTLDLPHVYLGYWVEGCRKMDYKTRYQPLEGLTPQGWRPLDPDSDDPSG